MIETRVVFIEMLVEVGIVVVRIKVLVMVGYRWLQ